MPRLAAAHVEPKPRPRERFNLIDYFLYPTRGGNFEHSTRVAEKDLPDETLKVQLMVRLDDNVVRTVRLKATTCSRYWHAVSGCVRLLFEGISIGGFPYLHRALGPAKIKS